MILKDRHWKIDKAGSQENWVEGRIFAGVIFLPYSQSKINSESWWGGLGVCANRNKRLFYHKYCFCGVHDLVQSLGTTRELNRLISGNRIRQTKWLQNFISSKGKRWLTWPAFVIKEGKTHDKTHPRELQKLYWVNKQMLLLLPFLSVPSTKFLFPAYFD